MKSQRSEARTLAVGCQVRGRILLHESFEQALCRCADAHLEGHQEIFSFQCEEGFSWRKQGDMGGYPTDVLSNDGEAMSCVSVSLERLQKDKAVTVSVDRGRWAAQAFKSHDAGKLGLFSEHLHAVRRKGFKCSAWIGFDAVQRRGRGSIEMGQECPQPSKVPFRVDGKPAVSLLGAKWQNLQLCIQWTASTLEWVVQFGSASFLSWSMNGRSAGSGS